MNNIGTAAITPDKYFAEITMIDEPRVAVAVGGMGMGCNPFESSPRIIISCREKMLRSFPVLYSNNQDISLGSKYVAIFEVVR